MPINVLYISGGIMHRGGIESNMMNYYRHIDKNVIHIDFVVHGFGNGVYDDEILEQGSKIFHVPVKSKDPFGNVRELRKIFSDNNYCIVHSHMDAMSYIPLKIAKRCGVPCRIAHSHNTDHLTNNPIKRMLNNYAKAQLPFVATDLFACSKPAGEWLFGKQRVKNNLVRVIPNAIEIEKYSFNACNRHDIRRQLGISDDAYVVGHIGRFDYQKNQSFLVDAFKQVLCIRPNAHLIMVGDGGDKGNILDKIRSEKIPNIHIEHACADVEKYYSAFDVFVLPSHFEGLGMVLVEAQVNGLKCIVSDTVPKEVNLTGNVKYLSLNNDLAIWGNLIANASRHKDAITPASNTRFAKYEISNAAHDLMDLYIEFATRKTKQETLK